MKSYRYKTKQEIAYSNFFRGYLIGLRASTKGCFTDYGFGPKGLGFYVYDKDYTVLGFHPDITI